MSTLKAFHDKFLNERIHNERICSTFTVSTWGTPELFKWQENGWVTLEYYGYIDHIGVLYKKDNPNKNNNMEYYMMNITKHGLEILELSEL